MGELLLPSARSIAGPVFRTSCKRPVLRCLASRVQSDSETPCADDTPPLRPAFAGFFWLQTPQKTHFSLIGTGQMQKLGKLRGLNFHNST
jgi:hypothetical protein